jgi:hypothetical protein
MGSTAPFPRRPRYFRLPPIADESSQRTDVRAMNGLVSRSTNTLGSSEGPQQRHFSSPHALVEEPSPVSQADVTARIVSTAKPRAREPVSLHLGGSNEPSYAACNTRGCGRLGHSWRRSRGLASTCANERRYRSEPQDRQGARARYPAEPSVSSCQSDRVGLIAFAFGSLAGE